ncbi:LysR family transcriptional regulator [uncultured Roseovarius sp.]|uniref:LysR family transcriptional regulator n=1 Tax=uncultured Roseovarius sp. TaxID=293344 RepID=UPI00261BA2E9|nr:LysR family transcriptional regulator [uncultured Roseovarius sp.]
MTLDQIKTFLELAETGSFNRAAQTLNVTQSTVSARIKALEQLVGHSLLIRNHSGCRLTAAGQQFLFYAKNIKSFWQKSLHTVTLRPEFRSMLSVGAQVSLWERLVLDWMAWMRCQAPDIALNIQTDYSPAQMAMLTDGLLDIGVMYQPRHTSDLIVETLLEEALVLVSTKQRELTTGWIEDYVFVDWGDVFLDAHAQAFPNMETAAITVGLGPLGLQYILKNGGSGYFPLRVVQGMIAEKKLYLMEGAPVLKRPAYLVYNADPIDKPALEIAIVGLREIAAKEAENQI